jgi:hypothetical protein
LHGDEIGKEVWDQLSLLSKERLHQVHASRREDSARHFNLVVEFRVIQNLKHGMHGACFRVFGSIDKPTDARVGDGSRAHGTRLHRDVEIAVGQAIVAYDEAGFAECLHFRVGRRIMARDRPVATPSYNVAILNNDGTNGHLTQRFSASGLAKCLLHEEFVGIGHKEAISS